MKTSGTAARVVGDSLLLQYTKCRFLLFCDATPADTVLPFTAAHHAPMFSNVNTDAHVPSVASVETVLFNISVIFQVILLNANGISGKAANKLFISLLFNETAEFVVFQQFFNV